MKDPYNGNFKCLKKDMSQTLEDGKIFHVHRLVEFIFLKIILVKTTYKCHKIPIKSLTVFFTEIEKSPKIHMES